MPWLPASVLDNAKDDDHDTQGVNQLLDLLMSLDLPPWHSDALCREYPADWWFPAKNGARREINHMADAFEVCSRCLVAGEGRDAALADASTAGVWSGTTEGARKKLRAAAAPGRFRSRLSSRA